MSLPRAIKPIKASQCFSFFVQSAYYWFQYFSRYIPRFPMTCLRSFCGPPSARHSGHLSPLLVLHCLFRQAKLSQPLCPAGSLWPGDRYPRLLHATCRSVSAINVQACSARKLDQEGVRSKSLTKSLGARRIRCSSLLRRHNQLATVATVSPKPCNTASRQAMRISPTSQAGSSRTFLARQNSY